MRRTPESSPALAGLARLARRAEPLDGPGASTSTLLERLQVVGPLEPLAGSVGAELTTSGGAAPPTPTECEAPFDRRLGEAYLPIEWPPLAWRLEPPAWPAPWGWTLGNELVGKEKATIRQAYAKAVAGAVQDLSNPSASRRRHARLQQVVSELGKAIDKLHGAFDAAGDDGGRLFATIRAELSRAGRAAYRARQLGATELECSERYLWPRGRRHRHDGLFRMVVLGLKAHSFTQGEIANFVELHLQDYWREDVVGARSKSNALSMSDARRVLVERIKAQLKDPRGDLPPASSPRKATGRSHRT